MRAQLVNPSDCAVPFISRAANFCWYYIMNHFPTAAERFSSYLGGVVFDLTDSKHIQYKIRLDSVPRLANHSTPRVKDWRTRVSNFVTRYMLRAVFVCYRHYIATTLYGDSTILRQHYIVTALYCDNTILRQHYIATTLY